MYYIKTRVSKSLRVSCSTYFSIVSVLDFLDLSLFLPSVIPTNNRCPRDSLCFGLGDEFLEFILVFELFEEYTALVERFDVRDYILRIAIDEAVGGGHVKEEAVADYFGGLVVRIGAS